MELVRECRFLNTYPVSHYRWANGFQAVLVENPVSPVAAYMTFYTVGSASENDQERGLAHFFEHMMFRETETLGDGDFDRIMAEIGGVGLNAYTSYDTTVYHVNVPAAHLERVISVEAERMVKLRLSPTLIERERGAVLGEMKMYRDMPSEQHWTTLTATAYKSHPYRHPIVGYPEQVEGFKDEDFARFYKSHYAPNRALVAVAGGFDPKRTLALLDQAYGELPQGSPRGAAAPEPGATAGERVEILHGKISTENLLLAIHAPQFEDPAIPSLILWATLLTAGQSSPLYRRIVLDGLGTHVSATLTTPELMLFSPGLFVIEASLQHGVRAEAAEQAIDQVLEEFLHGGIPEEELQRARNQIRLAFFGGTRTNMSLARQIGGYTLACDDPLHSERLLEQLATVTAEELRRTLEDYLIGAPRVVVVQRPESRSERP